MPQWQTSECAVTSTTPLIRRDRAAVGGEAAASVEARCSSDSEARGANTTRTSLCRQLLLACAASRAQVSVVKMNLLALQVNHGT